MIKFENAITQSLRAYKELVQTGGIQSTAEGDNMFLEIKGNLAGDLLVFISLKNKNGSALADIDKLIQSDGTLQKQSNSAFKTFRQKYRGLSLLPAALAWSINIGISALYAVLNSGRIHQVFYGEINRSEIIALLPIAGITAITFFLIKAYGIKILKPFLFLFIKTTRFYRKTSNRKIA